MQADIGLGFLIAILTSAVFHFEPTLWFIVFCVLAALLPDIDFTVEFLKHGSVGGKVIREHRELLHFPVTYIPIIFLVFLAAGPVWASALALGVVSHFIHDSIGVGWGIKWFWPVHKHHYKFFAKNDGSMAWRWLQKWKVEDMPAIAAMYGLEHWIRDIYLKPFPIRVPMWLFWVNISEWAVFIIGAVGLWVYLT